MKRTFPLALACIVTAGALSGIQIPLSAHAEGALPLSEAPVTFNAENAELHLPESYEQYLPLENPSYVAMSEEHIAIADNSTIYIYDRAKNEYTPYHHTAPDGQDTVSKIQFTDKGEMFFRDTGNRLYRYNFEENDKEIINNISCQTFLIHGDYLYIANETTTVEISGFSYVSLKELDFDNLKSLPEANNIRAYNPRMAFANNTLYCIVSNNSIYAYDATTHEFIKELNGSMLDKSCIEIANLQFVCAYRNELFYTVKGAGNQNNGLWRTDLSGKAEKVFAGDDYSTITSYGDKLYCIQGSVIRELDVHEHSVKATGYEISSNSSSNHRLADANGTVRTKDLVAIADKGNKRISVYNRLEGSYTVIPCVDESGVPFTPEHIAIDKEDTLSNADNGGEPWKDRNVETDNKIAVSSGNKIYECIYTRHTDPAHQRTEFKFKEYSAPQNVKGMSYVYGECYYITEYDGYGTLSNATASELHFASGLNSPDAIASDIYGNLYVAFGNKVYSFPEDAFQESGASSELVTELSVYADKAYVSLSVDYEGNIWHLTEDGALYCNNEKMATIDGSDFVYLNAENDYPVSFALSFEDDEIYFNFKNYVVKTDAYALNSLPSLNKITAGESKTKAFELADPSNLFVQVPAGSVGFEIALDELKTGESDYFPYESYFRLEGETRRGVLLYEPQESGYYVVALYNSELHIFTANLFHSSKNHLVADSDYFNEPAEENETAFISSDVSFCSAPCLYPAPANERISTLADSLLARGTKIKVLGYATGEDRVYAYVEILDSARTAQKGYIPRSYLTKNDPLGVAQDHYVLGYLKGNAGIKLVSEDGTELEITEKTQAKLYKNADGTYRAEVVKDGVLYKGTVGADDIFRGTTDALRISLIVILSVLALVIIFGYVFLMFPRKKKKK